MRKTPKILPNLTSEEFSNLKRVINDPFFFSQFIYVINSLNGKTRFDLYDFQKAVLWEFLTNRFNIVLKFRQAGLTELIAMYALWLAMYHPEKNILIISIKERVAKRLLKKIKYMYRNLPEYLKTPVINGRGEDIGTATELEFSNGSLITSVPTTEDAGRSEALSLLIIDEAAIVKWANTIWAAAFPTLSTGGSAILNSCVTGDTRILGKNGYFRVDMIAPKEFGKHNVEALGLEVLTHNGRFKKVLGALNKGELTTWEVENNKGKILKATPAHKLLTTRGWKSIKYIIKNDLNCIFYDNDLGLEDKPKTTKPPKEIRKDILGYPNYQISNWGKVYYKETGKEKKQSTNNEGYKRISLWHNGKSRKFQVSILVATHFIGVIPEGSVVDHIDNTRDINHVNNLQIITRKENAQRANKHNHTLNLATRSKSCGVNYTIIGYILEKLEQHGNSYGFCSKLIKLIKKRFGVTLQKSYISRIVNGKRNKNIYISKLKINREFKECIYDICVEDDESYITDSEYINHNTPYGIGNFFHKTWVDSCAKGNNFNPIRLRWQMHPDRDINWYNEQRAILGPRRTAQEIDGDFLTSGNNVFDLLDIRAIEDALEDYPLYDTKNDPKFNKIKTYNGLLKIFTPPRAGESYSIGSDISTGRARDYSTLTLYDRHGEEHAVFKGKIPINAHTELLGDLGKIYNWAYLAPESNDIGLGVSMKLSEQGYRNLYYSKKLLRKKGQSKPDEEKIPGWYTTKRNRPIIIAGLEEDIRLERLITKDPYFVQEAYTFIYDNQNKPIAMGKGSNDGGEMDSEEYTDDAIIGKSIGNYIRKGKLNNKVIMPK